MKLEDRLYEQEFIFFQAICSDDCDGISGAIKSLEKIAKSALKRKEASIAEDVFRIIDTGATHAFRNNRNETALMLNEFAGDLLRGRLKVCNTKFANRFYDNQCCQSVKAANFVFSESNLLKQILTVFSAPNLPAAAVSNKMFEDIDHWSSKAIHYPNADQIKHYM
ncbi:hypothetical protein [Burkholderia pyrrocinia]